MNLKNILIASTLFLTPIFATAQKYPVNENGFPTSEGIKKYVYDNEENFITDFEKYIKDTLWQAYFEVDNLNFYAQYKGWELGWHSGGGSILLSDQENYSGYSLANLSKYEKSQFLEANNFVRGVALHELTHAYIEQISAELTSKKIQVQKEYSPTRPFKKDYTTIYSQFIEDGISEYVSKEMGEMVLPKKLFTPKNLEEFTDTTKIYQSRYQYAYKYIKEFLDFYGVKTGITILITNSPPTEKEILNSEKYFSRLEHYGGLKLSRIIKPQDFKTR